MAFPLSCLDVRDVVSVFDPAIDKAASGARLLDYVRDGYPPSWSDYLVLRDGQVPTLWSMAPLDYEVVASIQRKHERIKQTEGEISRDLYRTESFAQAFRFACSGWKNLDWLPWAGESVGGRTVLAEATLKKLSKILRPIINELGHMALGEAVLGDDIKN